MRQGTRDTRKNNEIDEVIQLAGASRVAFTEGADVESIQIVTLPDQRLEACTRCATGFPLSGRLAHDVVKSVVGAILGN